GSPRYTKNKRREKEIAEKVNINNSRNQEEIQTSKAQRKSKRELPSLPVPEDTISYIQKDEDAAKSEIAFEPGDTGDGKEPKRKIKKGKSKGDESQVEDAEVSSKPTFDDSLVLGVYVHRTDRLKTDLLISHPMVKIHVIDEITGQYVKKEDCHRPVSSFYEQENVDHILPIMTQPYDFKKNKSIIPEWQEQIIFNERFGYFVEQNDESPRVILFFELVGTNGVLNIDSKLRLQLFCPPPRSKRQAKKIEVAEWWRKYPRNKYTSTLYVTVKGIKLPEHVDPSIRSMMALQEERGSTSYSELQNEVTKRSLTQPLDSKPPALRWSRLPGQVCRIPNKPMLAFRGGQMGCFTVLFSHAGTILAAACADRDSFPVVEWNVERLLGTAQKVLPHPSFVYCAQYHPTTQSLVVTGGYDSLVRVWRLDVSDVNGQLLQEFEGHNSFINTVCFDSEGRRMFSADNTGLIIVWKTSVNDSRLQQSCNRWCIEKKIDESDLSGIPINMLQLHPNGRCLLIHAKDSVLRMMDLRILAVKKYTGATNYRERIYSTFTPCGNFIFSGSEDGMAYVWNTDTGDQVAAYSELCYPTALHGVSFHPHENMVAFCAFGQSQPVHVYLYDRKVSQLEVHSIKTMSRSTSADTKTVRNTPDPAVLQDRSAVSAMDQFAQTTRLALKMQCVKEQLDSVLTGLNATLPPPSLLSPHSKLQFSGSLAEQLIPQAALSTQSRFSPVGQRLKEASSFRLQAVRSFWPLLFNPSTTVFPIQVVSLYDYRANRSDELTLHRGDVIQVLYKDNDNWWFGRLANGQQGYFLASYVADQSKLILFSSRRKKKLKKPGAPSLSSQATFSDADASGSTSSRRRGRSTERPLPKRPTGRTNGAFEPDT
uniref:Abelson helper integration site 1 n=1 Tax=Seriola lalandi dorsalis TaxID=1841481 RepID=A0A3B4WAG6_SERLL